MQPQNQVQRFLKLTNSHFFFFSVNYGLGLILITKRPHKSHCKKFLQKLLQWCFIQYHKQSTWSHTLILTMKAKGQEWMLAWWTQQFSLFASFQLAGHSCSSQNSLAAVALLAKEQRKGHNFIFISYSSKLFLKTFLKEQKILYRKMSNINICSERNTVMPFLSLFFLFCFTSGWSTPRAIKIAANSGRYYTSSSYQPPLMSWDWLHDQITWHCYNWITRTYHLPYFHYQKYVSLVTFILSVFSYICESMQIYVCDAYLASVFVPQPEEPMIITTISDTNPKTKNIEEIMVCMFRLFCKTTTESQNSPGWKGPQKTIRSELLWEKGD